MLPFTLWTDAFTLSVSCQDIPFQEWSLAPTLAGGTSCVNAFLQTECFLPDRIWQVFVYDGVPRSKKPRQPISQSDTGSVSLRALSFTSDDPAQSADDTVLPIRCGSAGFHRPPPLREACLYGNASRPFVHRATRKLSVAEPPKLQQDSFDFAAGTAQLDPTFCSPADQPGWTPGGFLPTSSSAATDAATGRTAGFSQAELEKLASNERRIALPASYKRAAGEIYRLIRSAGRATVRGWFTSAWCDFPESQHRRDLYHSAASRRCEFVRPSVRQDTEPLTPRGTRGPGRLG
ncbi:unnamed protein product [Polarella glacialis]|uniref:Uncharacterized protein n=1 Tax=Polarella glacialis TaxID=89957 RepID=A0A813GQB4_POLGL|nr:unnamed protein product [Polarella glacialis]CAE8690561.1 unnamed protein product [Polarella glacialis]